MTTLTDHLRQIDAGELDIGYAELGPADGPAVIPLPRSRPFWRGPATG